MLSQAVAPARGNDTPSKRVIWLTDDGYTTQDLSLKVSGTPTWTYTNTVRWHEVWQAGIQLGSGHVPLAVSSGTTGWAEPGSWVRVTVHATIPNGVGKGTTTTDCTYQKNYTDGTHNLAVAPEPFIQGVTANEAKVTWNTSRGAEFCAAPAGFVPKSGYTQAELFAQSWMNQRLINLATVPANGDGTTSQQKVEGIGGAGSIGSAVEIDHETLTVATHKP